MINSISSYSVLQPKSNYNIRHAAPAFQGKISVISKYVQPIDNKYIPLLDKLTDFFSGINLLLKDQQKILSTQSKHLEVSNLAEPIPEAKIKISENRWIKIRPKKYKTDENTKIDLYHFEINNPPEKHNFDIIVSDEISSPKKGDLFSYNYHRADRHPIRTSEVTDVNRCLKRFGDDILNITKKYQKKLS